MKINKIEDTMPDSAIPEFFKRATGREYVDETSVNDIRRMLMLFWNEKMDEEKMKKIIWDAGTMIWDAGYEASENKIKRQFLKAFIPNLGE